MKRISPLLVALALLLSPFAVRAQSLGGGVWVNGIQTNVLLLNTFGVPVTNIFSQQFPSETLTVGNLTNSYQIFGGGYGYAVMTYYGTNPTPVSTNWVFPNCFSNYCSITGTNISGLNLFRTNFPPQSVSIAILPAAYFTTGAVSNGNTASINP